MAVFAKNSKPQSLLSCNKLTNQKKDQSASSLSERMPAVSQLSIQCRPMDDQIPSRALSATCERIYELFGS